MKLWIFNDLWQLALIEYDDLVGLDWRWQRTDGAMTKAPLRGESTGNNPTDRGKRGTKRSIITEANGVPTGLVVAGANVHDIRLPEVTIKSCLARAPRTAVNHHEHLCLDKGYDSTAIRELVEVVYGYTSHIRFRGEERRLKRSGIRRRMKHWVVERTHGRLNRFRGILIRWEKKAENHLAALHLACAYYTYSKAGVFG